MYKPVADSQAHCRSPDRCVGADSFLTKDILTSPFPFSLIHWHTKPYQITLRASKKYVRSAELFTDTNTGNVDFRRIILESPISLLITHRGNTRFTRFKGNIHLHQHQSTHIVNFGGDRTVAAGVPGRRGQQEPGRSANYRTHDSSYGSCGLFNNSYKPSLLSCLPRPLSQADSSPARAQILSLRFELSGAATQASQLCCMSICLLRFLASISLHCDVSLLLTAPSCHVCQITTRFALRSLLR